MSKFTIVAMVIALAAISGSQALFLPFCPNGLQMVNCFVDPCAYSSCPAYPGAVCQSNYCGGCFADYFYNGKKVNCGLKAACNGARVVNCLVAPCKLAKCTKYPNAECRNNNCAGCKAEFFVNNVQVQC